MNQNNNKEGWSPTEKAITVGLTLLGSLGLLTMLANGSLSELARIITLNR